MGAHVATKAPYGQRSDFACEGRLGRPRRAAANLFEAALLPPDTRRLDPGHRLREHRQPPAGARSGPSARNRPASESWSRTASDRAPAPYREHGPRGAWRHARSGVRDLGHPFPDAASREWTRGLHVACETELAGARGGGRALLVDGLGVRTGSSHSVDAERFRAGTQGIADR